jgi:hypothetical protein
MNQDQWIIEFRIDFEENYIGVFRGTREHKKTVVLCFNSTSWYRLAEGTFREGQGRVRSGFMHPRPLRKCIQRIHKMHQFDKSVQTRLRNINTDEIIVGELFV